MPTFFFEGRLGRRAGENEMDVEGLVRPVVEGSGLELWEVTYRKEGGRMVLRVTVDREDGADLDTISQLSERLSRRLDLEDFGPRGYALEVSSPGLERPLRTPRHFARSVGRPVKVKTVEPVAGSRTHQGALVSADAEAIVVATAGGELRVPYGDIASARTVFDWGRPRREPGAKPSRGGAAGAGHGAPRGA
ncbi:MAG TPA: ribosome maturation factor RimP [Actinomycetota bacterium]|nr:ribosome maturation factor RimP [Actinomycetota bacterium]